MSDPAPKTTATKTKPLSRRTILRHHFEGGGAMYLDVWGDVTTDMAIWALKSLLAVKERELEKVIGGN